VAQVKGLPTKCEALSSNPSTKTNEKHVIYHYSENYRKKIKSEDNRPKLPKHTKMYGDNSKYIYKEGKNKVTKIKKL
jgi:hypothetical protein